MNWAGSAARNTQSHRSAPRVPEPQTLAIGPAITPCRDLERCKKSTLRERTTRTLPGPTPSFLATTSATGDRHDQPNPNTTIDHAALRASAAHARHHLRRRVVCAGNRFGDTTARAHAQASGCARASFAATTFDVSIGPRSVTTGDFNADGELDLATVNQTTEAPTSPSCSATVRAALPRR